MEWYEELDFDENPFSTNPKKFASHLSGMETVLEDVFYRVAAGSMLFVEGKNGSGKSSILWNVIKKYRGRGKIIYVDCSQIEKELNIEKLLVNKYGFIRGRIMKRKPKNMILLLDNIEELSPKNSERVKYFFDQGYLHSVVFAGVSYKKVKFSKSLKERINGELNVSFNQTVNQLKNKISEVLTLKLVDTDEINTSLMKQEFVEKSILSILKNWDLNTADAVGTTIHFNENSEKNISKFVNKTCASYIKKGLEIKFDRKGAGFSISPKESSFEISFDDESLLNFFKSNLKPYTKKVLFN